MNLIAELDFILEKNQTHADQIANAGELDNVDPVMAKMIVKSGLRDGQDRDDKVPVKPSTWSASVLNPSQTSMVLGKAIGMALFMIDSGKIGGDLGAIVSSDNFIMDGHHRWAATILASGKTGKVGGFRANLKGENLLKVLNVITKGLFNVQHGKAGKGKLSEFTSSNVKTEIEGMVANGIPGESPKSPEDIKASLIKGFGSVEDGIKIMSKNANLITKKVPSWAPDRKQMPVIEPAQVSKAADTMKRGVVDHDTPFAESKDNYRKPDITSNAHDIQKRYQYMKGEIPNFKKNGMTLKKIQSELKKMVSSDEKSIENWHEIIRTSEGKGNLRGHMRTIGDLMSKVEAANKLLKELPDIWNGLEESRSEQARFIGLLTEATTQGEVKVIFKTYIKALEHGLEDHLSAPDGESALPLFIDAHMTGFQSELEQETDLSDASIGVYMRYFQKEAEKVLRGKGYNF